MERLRAVLHCLKWWIPAALVYGGITWLSGQSRLPGPEALTHQFIWFKLGHVVAYSTLSMCVWFALWKNGFTARTLMLSTWYILLILSSLDELHQQFTPGRTSKVTDVMIDLVATWAVLQVLKRYNRHIPSGM